MGGHRAGAGVGEQIDQNVGGGQKKKIVVGGAKKLFAICPRGPADGFDAFNAERLDDVCAAILLLSS